MVERADIAVDSPEDTVVVVGVGERYNLDGGELLNVGDSRFVVNVLAVVGLVVLVVKGKHPRGNEQADFTGITENRGYHACALIEHFADIAGGDSGEVEGLYLIDGFPGGSSVGGEVGMTFDTFTEIFVDTVGGFHCATGNVGVGVLAHTVDITLFALVVQLLGGFYEEILDKREFYRVRAFAVQVANPRFFEVLQALELVDEHNPVHTERFCSELVRTFRNLVELAVCRAVRLRELAQPEVHERFEVLVS